MGFRSRGLSILETKRIPKGPGRSGVDPTRAGEIHRCPRSEGRSVGRHCFGRNSRDARDAGGSPVGRKHRRVRSRVTRQSQVGAVKGDQKTDSHFDTDIDVCVTSQPCFLEREAGAVAHVSLAQETLRKRRGPPRRRKGKPKTPASDSNCMVSFMWSCGVIFRYISCTVTSSSSVTERG